jgi:hypothetical protein
VPVEISTDDLDAITSDVIEMFRSHPIVSTLDFGSATGAKAAAYVLGDAPEDIHPKSPVAVRITAVIQGVAEAVIDRLSDELGWLEADTERAYQSLKTRRRTHPCEGLLAKGPRCNNVAPIGQWCKTCEVEIAKEIAES